MTTSFLFWGDLPLQHNIIQARVQAKPYDLTVASRVFIPRT